MNVFSGIGNLGGDAEFHESERGVGVLRFTIAISDSWKNDKGEKQERTNWVRCVKFGPGSDKLANYLTKGKKIGVQGSLRVNQYEKDGVKQTSTEVVVDKVHFLSSKGESNRPVDTEDPSEESEESPF